MRLQKRQKKPLHLSQQLRASKGNPAGEIPPKNRLQDATSEALQAREKGRVLHPAAPQWP